MNNDKAPENMMAEPLLSTRQVAQAIGRHPTFISACVHEGYAPVAYNMHRESKLIAWLEAHPGFKSTTAYPCKVGIMRPPPTMTDKMLAVSANLLRLSIANKSKR
jgi:hypothetical protein